MNSTARVVATVLVSLGVACSSGDGDGTVDPPARCTIQSIELSPSSTDLTVGSTTTLTATVAQANCGTVSLAWSSASPNIASVSQGGVVTGVAVGGPVVISATAGGRTGTASVRIVATPVQSVSVTPNDFTLAIGGQTSLTATPRDGAGNALTGRQVTWQTTNPSIATVTQQGQVTGVAIGATTVTATSEGKMGNATVNVVPVTGPRVLIHPHPASVYVGASIQLSAILRDNAGNVITGQPQWQSSSPALATITSTGLVTGVAAGTVTITATHLTTSATTMVAVKPLSARLAYLWADNPSVASYQPDSRYRHNGLGGTITITRTQTGVYDVVLGGFRKGSTDREVPVVTAYGNIPSRCQPGEWRNSGANDLTIQVICVAPGGTLIDSRFTMLVVGDGSLPSRLGFAAATQSSASSYAPDTAFVYNSSGRVMVAQRTSTGTYVLDLGVPRGAADLPETFLVSSTAPLASWCNLAQWTTTTNVNCFGQSTAKIDASYNLLMLERGRAGQRFALTLADQETAASYTPHASYTRTSSGLPVVIRRTATGRYVLTLHGLAKIGTRTETILVSAYSNTNVFCTVAEWNTVAINDLDVVVNCWAADGSSVDSRFTLALIE
jgi:uncharacterized protein YjdB